MKFFIEICDENLKPRRGMYRKKGSYASMGSRISSPFRPLKKPSMV